MIIILRMAIHFLLIIFISCVYASDTEDVQVEDGGILLLNQNNFHSVIDQNEFVFVQFYAPWCRHCKELAPEYLETAKQLSEQGHSIKLGKVEAITETDLAEAHDIKIYPTLKLFKHGSSIDYTGPRKADGMIKWLLKKTGTPVKQIDTVDEAKQLIDDNEVTIIGFFKDPNSERANAFVAVANSVDDYPFGVISNENLFKEFDSKDGGIFLFKKFDEGKIEYDGDDDEKNVKKFVSTYSFPLVVELNKENADKIFANDIKDHLLLFLDKKEKHFNTVIEEVRPIAETFRGQILFVVINVRNNAHQRILNFFDVKGEDLPTVRLTNVDKMSKYEPDRKELTAENLRSFLQDYQDGKMKQKLKSEDLPEDWNKQPVKVLVGTNFKSIAHDKDKDVLVEFYAPWCKHCKDLAPIYEELAKHFQSNEKVVIAKMDVTKNEVEDTEIHSYPTIKLYRKEDNKVIDYKEKRNLENLIKFIENSGVTEEDERKESKDKDEL